MKIETLEKAIVIVAAVATITSGVIALAQVLKPSNPPPVVVQPCQVAPISLQQ